MTLLKKYIERDAAYLFRDSLLITAVCLLVYLANGATIGGGDTIPNSLLAFNLLENHTLLLDQFRNSYLYYGGPTPYFFVETQRGSLVSGFPTGVAILTFPFYLLFYLYLKLAHSFAPLDLTVAAFEPVRLFYKKLAATLITTVTVILFYLTCREKFNRRTSLITTGVFAFATNIWMTGSQALWQHSSSNLLIVGLTLCFMKVIRTTDLTRKRRLLVLAGILIGLLQTVRPTNALLALGFVAYAVVAYRRDVSFLALGLLAAAPGVFWNWYQFDAPFEGSYARVVNLYPHVWTLSQFLQGAPGLLISPSRGLLVFFPLAVYALPAALRIIRKPKDADDLLLICLLIGSVSLGLFYSFYIFWHGSHTYGPRYLVEALPAVCYLIAYPVTRLFPVSKTEDRRSPTGTINRWLFIGLAAWSVMAQAVGAFSQPSNWNAIPTRVDWDAARFWQVRDSQLERHARALYARLFEPVGLDADYVQGLDGEIIGVYDEKGQPLTAERDGWTKEKFRFSVVLKNTGTVDWYGYERGLKDPGEIRIRTRFYPEGSTVPDRISENRLFVSGIPKPGAVVTTTGYLKFPRVAGTYRLELELIAESLYVFSGPRARASYTFTVQSP